MKRYLWPSIAATLLVLSFAVQSCKNSGASTAMASDDAAKAVYIPPGKHDEFYLFTSGGFNGQVGVYGLPSGRLFRIIPVFSIDAEKGYGFTEETKPLLQTSYGFIPWDDTHHPVFSMTAGKPDGRWLFINANNTPRIARIDLRTFRTVEIIEIPNSGGNHASPFCTENTEYVVAGTRFSVPPGGQDVPISSYKQHFKGVISFVQIEPTTGHMSVAFQILAPPFKWDLSRCGKGPSHDWSFFSCYNSEKAYTLLEVNASQKDKDFILAVNWKKAEEYAKQGKGKRVKATYYSNRYDEATHTASNTVYNDVLVLDPKECPNMMYLMPCPKSPHGVDVDPSGEYIVAGGKLATVIPVYSFSRMQKAIQDNAFEGDVDGIPIIKYEACIAGEVQKPGLGPLHTEFDGKGYAYTSMFVSSEIVKWKLGTWEVVDRIPTYYSIGHLCIPGGDSKQPWGKYVIALNKITKDRYLPTGPELTQSAQLYSIEGEKMKLLLDFPTVGEPHYAQACPADLLAKNSVRIFKLAENKHPFAVKAEKDVRVERKGNEVHVYMTMIRSHFSPDNIEGIKVGDVVYFHVTNLEQDWDIPHGFTVQGAQNAEMLIMPGETQTLKWTPTRSGVYPFYCTDFCSALHQEMQGYVRVSAAGAAVPISYGIGK
ncbi:MAG: Sec-dependent nitrous-oxide reductase [Chlorobi bacterium]|nr:Sec-dependent nitrous-oxide reductase [Chlorobiota bacterium]